MGRVTMVNTPHVNAHTFSHKGLGVATDGRCEEGWAGMGDEQGCRNIKKVRLQRKDRADQLRERTGVKRDGESLASALW